MGDAKSYESIKDIHVHPNIQRRRIVEKSEIYQNRTYEPSTA